MIFESTDPLKSREHFAYRRFINLAVLGGGFIVFVLIWSPLWLFVLPFSLPVSLIAIVLGYAAALAVVYYFFLIWGKRPIRLRCPRCRKFIITNTPWVCGYCRQPNLNPIDFPFVFKCGNPECGLEPKTYRCHHATCQQFIFLTPDKDEINYAFRYNSPAEITKTDVETKALKEERAKRRDEHLDKMLDKNEELNLAQVSEQLEYVRQRIRKAKTMGASNKDTLLSEIEALANKKVEMDEAVDTLKAAVSEKFKNNEPKIMRHHDAIDEAAREVRFKKQ